ncbi:6-phosphofructokinase [Candidatus Karelsulcia muelleri]|uniref:ATP-dependent 6-phosphofructokinase n=1 Tax=Candidatus Karelsulcia muelleri PSPU TaxID=1189303 RepID=A0AAD1B0Y4_9FLAO|nr:6-phosphofructokinase [Candidatus Karelsulcia muelleri]NJJ98770.1 6-phosphofructokinase [Candidatus Karelsulcia muelleri]BAO66422.1 6-phosphofructokinase [Candidatus Karelsulcia muelleri PSPU]
MNIGKIGILTSGGDSPGMNAAIRAVVRTASYYCVNCIGISLGYKGLINNEMRKVVPTDVNNLIHRGGTLLKTARSEEFKTKFGRKKANINYKKNGLEGLIVIGGDGSFTGAMIFGQEYNIPIIGIPGTIDNDIYGTDFTVGYDTALNTAIEAIDKIRDTAKSHNRLFFIEVMGKDSGFLALNSGIATGALDILIPEKKYNLDKLFYSIEKVKQKGKYSSIIIVSEGKKLGGVYDLAKTTKKKFPDYDIRVSILGHIQRGGYPTCSDRVLASRLGVASVEALISGKKNVMTGIKANKVIFTPFLKAIKKKRKIDIDLIKISDIIAC